MTSSPQSATQINKSYDSIIRGSITVLAVQVVLLICAIINNFLVAQMLNPEGKGMIYIIQVISGLGLVFFNLGLGPAAIYYIGRDRQHSLSNILHGVAWPSILLGGIPIIAYSFFWPRIPHFIHQVEPKFFLMALAAIPAFVLTWNIGYLSLALHKMWNYNLLRFGQPAIFSLLLLWLVILGKPTVGTVAIVWLISVLIPALYALSIALLILRKENGVSLLPRTSFIPDAFRFGWRSHLGAVTQYLQHRSDVLLVGYFLPLRDLGIYSLAVSLAEVLWYVPHAIATVLMPHVAASDDHATQLTPMFCRASLAVTASLSLIVAIASSWLIPRVLPAFSSAVKALWLLLPGVIVASIFKVISSDFNGRGTPMLTFQPAIVTLGMASLVGIFVVPRFGIMGAALVTSAGYTLNSALYLHSYSRLTAVPLRSLLLMKRADFLGLNVVWRSLRSW